MPGVGFPDTDNWPLCGGELAVSFDRVVVVDSENPLVNSHTAHALNLPGISPLLKATRRYPYVPPRIQVISPDRALVVS